MKKLIVMALALSTVLAAQAISLAEARAQIAQCVTNPAKMTEVMKQIPSSDQTAFLAEVNAAIASKPGANEARAAAYLNANKAALLGAEKGNLQAMLAEVYATVPVEVLPVLNERLAEDLFNRNADPSKTYTDEQFVAIVSAATKSIGDRVASADDGAVRATFAICMFNAASGGTPTDLAETLTGTLPESMRDTVSKNLPDALQGKYDAMLDSADAGDHPSTRVVMRLAGPQVLQALLSKVVEGAPLVDSVIADIYDGIPEPSDMEMNVTPPSEPVFPPSEPQGYQGQY